MPDYTCEIDRVKPPAKGRGFGLLQATDLRDHAHLARAALPLRRAPIARRHWSPGPVLDQGENPYCVGFAWRNLLDAGPVKNPQGVGPAAEAIYHAAQDVDEWPGPPPAYEGTSVRAGAKVLQGTGLVPQYLWAFDLATAVQWVLRKGPCVFGTIWPDSMMDPDPAGFLKVEGSYVDAGGHAYCVCGADTKGKCPDGTTGYFEMFQSWGPNWGKGGLAKIPFSAAEILIHEGGEVCMPSEVRGKPAPVRGEDEIPDTVQD